MIWIIDLNHENGSPHAQPGARAAHTDRLCDGARPQELARAAVIRILFILLGTLSWQSNHILCATFKL